MTEYDVIIIGAGAAGMMCAVEAGKRGRRTLLLDHAKNPGEKIRISGGGRSNFTNLHTSPEDFISQNRHFCKSALKRFTQKDFLKLIEKHHIHWHEKTLGQLFCDDSAQQIVQMFLDEMEDASVDLMLETKVNSIKKMDTGFSIRTNQGDFSTTTLVMATGGISIPKMGATDFSYRIAKQFDIKLIEPTPGLVPLTFEETLLNKTKELSGLSVDPCEVSFRKKKFREAILLTHKGISGPAILQISSYWQKGESININLLPDQNILAELKERRQSTPRIRLHSVLAQYLPKRLAVLIASEYDIPLADISDKKFNIIADRIHRWKITPTGTEGFRTAEVTCGGIDTDEISSKTFEAKKVDGLYFIGEALDVTGHLGGFNFQWAWSSGWCAGQFV